MRPVERRRPGMIRYRDEAMELRPRVRGLLAIPTTHQSLQARKLWKIRQPKVEVMSDARTSTGSTNHLGSSFGYPINERGPMKIPVQQRVQRIEIPNCIPKQAYYRARVPQPYAPGGRRSMYWTEGAPSNQHLDYGSRRFAPNSASYKDSEPHFAKQVPMPRSVKRRMIHRSAVTPGPGTLTAFHDPFASVQEKKSPVWETLAKEHPMASLNHGGSKAVSAAPQTRRRMVQTSKRSVDYLVCPKWGRINNWKGINTRKQSLTVRETTAVVSSSQEDPVSNHRHMNRPRKKRAVVWVKPRGSLALQPPINWGVEDGTPETGYKNYRIYNDVARM